jgi:hypothetical protein
MRSGLYINKGLSDTKNWLKVTQSPNISGGSKVPPLLWSPVNVNCLPQENPFNKFSGTPDRDPYRVSKIISKIVPLPLSLIHTRDCFVYELLVSQ